MSQKIGHYTIVSELGRGGMGVVYKAHEESLNRHVALKVLGEHLTSDPTFLTRFTREAQAAAALSHPNIIQVYFIGEDAGKHFFVMEFVPGESLLELVRREGRIDNPQAAGYISQAAAGLASAHDLGVLHRDIKPANLMVTNKGLVKIADFGLALPMEAATRLTATGMLMGTPGYLSPEQCRGEKVDHRTDIYSLGITYYELLTGRMPFQADSPLALIRKILEQDPPDVVTVNQDVDPDARAILLKMIAKDREERYQTCHEVAADLDDYLAEHQVRTGGRRTRTRTAAESAAAVAAGDAPTVASTPAAGFTHAPFGDPVAEPAGDAATIAAPSPDQPTIGEAATVAAPPPGSEDSDPAPTSAVPPPPTERVAPPIAETLPPPVAATTPSPAPAPLAPPSALARRPEVAPVPVAAAAPNATRSRTPLVLLVLLLILLAGGAAAGVVALVSPSARASMARLIPGVGAGKTAAATTVAVSAAEAETAESLPATADGDAVSHGAPAPDRSAPAETAAALTGAGLAARHEPDAADTQAPAAEPAPGGRQAEPAPRREAAASQPEAAARPHTATAAGLPAPAVPAPRRQESPAPEPAAAVAPPPPAAQALHGTAVVVTGERLLAGALETVLVREVASRGETPVDLWSLPESEAVLRGRDDVSAAQLLPVLREDGVARLMLARVEFVASRELSYMGRRDTAYTSRITITVYDVASARPTGRSVSENVEYTALNADRQVAQALRPRSQDIQRLLD